MACAKTNKSMTWDMIKDVWSRVKSHKPENVIDTLENNENLQTK